MNHNNIEIERKFLVINDSYKALAVAKHHIVQGYLCQLPGRTVRVRIWDNDAYLTIKVKKDDGSLARHEWEFPIPVETAKEMLEHPLKPLLEKTRWICPGSLNGIPADDDKGNDLIWEVDEFEGRKAGLVIAEIELESDDQHFEKPPFIGAEVTGDPAYYNANM